MNKDEKDFETRVAARLHQRERMRAWIHVAAHTDTDNADYMLAAFDKRFPAPALPVPDQSAMGMAVAGTILAQTAELTTLRDKARLWDAVASGQVRLFADTNGFWCEWDDGNVWDTVKPTAAEAVQAAIDAGALR